MSDQAVLTERRDGVLIVTLNRPDARNAVNQAVAQGIADALDALDADDELAGRRPHRRRQGLLRGHGPQGVRQGRAAVRRATAASRASRSARARKPLIAAVEGFAVAGGFEIALACDLIVASKGAQLGIPEVKRGAHRRRGGALLRLPQRMPYGIAMELALTGDLMLAERGHELGLVNRLAEPGEALDGALELAATISAQRAARAGRVEGDPAAASATGPRRSSGPSRARSPADLRLRGRAARARPRSPRSASPVAGSLTHAPPAVDADPTAGPYAQTPLVAGNHPVMVGPAQIVAFGGGGFSMEAGNPLLDDYVLSLTQPASGRKVCFLPTASGDADHYVVRFYRALLAVDAASRRTCRCSGATRARASDATSTSTCSTRTSSTSAAAASSRCLGVWRAHGLDEVLRRVLAARRRAVRPERRLAVLVRRTRSARSTASRRGRGPRPAAALQLRALRRRAGAPRGVPGGASAAATSAPATPPTTAWRCTSSARTSRASCRRAATAPPIESRPWKVRRWRSPSSRTFLGAAAPLAVA